MVAEFKTPVELTLVELTDAELDAVTGGQDINVTAALANVALGANALNINLLGVQPNIAQGQSTGAITFNFGAA